MSLSEAVSQAAFLVPPLSARTVASNLSDFNPPVESNQMNKMMDNVKQMFEQIKSLVTPSLKD